MYADLRKGDDADRSLRAYASSRKRPGFLVQLPRDAVMWPPEVVHSKTRLVGDGDVDDEERSA